MYNATNAASRNNNSILSNGDGDILEILELKVKGEKMEVIDYRQYFMADRSASSMYMLRALAPGVLTAAGSFPWARRCLRVTHISGEPSGEGLAFNNYFYTHILLDVDTYVGR
jgi:hypothetical protein